MCTIISIANNKGGVGKTTATLNIGAGLAKTGKRVLVIDLDPQANLSMCFKQDEDTQHNIGRVLLDQLTIDDILVETESYHLHLLPGSRECRKIEKLLTGETAGEQRLKKHFRKNKIKDKYDFVLIDCPPALGNFTTNALVASDYYIVPVTPEFFAYKGIEGVLEYIREIVENELNYDLELMGILINQFNEKQRNTTRKSIAEKIRQSKLAVFETDIRQNSDLIKASLNARSIFAQNPSSNGAKDFTKLIEEILTITK